MRIFLSYRRRPDTNHAAGRLADRLRGRFGKDNVFVDVTSLEPGRRYRDQITEAINECDVLLVVIGKNWIEAPSEIVGDDDEEDLMQVEIVAGLERGIPVVPVLVDGAPEPRADELPPQLEALAARQAVRLSYASFDADADRLISSLTGRGRSRRPVIVGAATVAVAAVATVLTVALNSGAPQAPPSTAAQAPATAPVPSPTPVSTADCDYAANGSGVVAPDVSAAGRQAQLAFCPVRINGGSLPITGPFELDGRILGPQSARQEILLVNYADQKTCDAFGVAPARGAFLSTDTNLGSADGSWTHTDHLGYPEAVTIARHYEYVTASSASINALKNDRKNWDDAHLGNDGDYPGILSPPQDVEVLATFLVPAGRFPNAAPCKG